MTPVASIRAEFAARGVGALVAALYATCRVAPATPGDALDQLRENGEPVILTFWHDHLVIVARYLQQRLIRAGVPLTLLASRSRDGELGARLAKLWGADVARGSTSRGGTEALRTMYRAVARGRSSAVVVPDGPRGPRHLAKPGGLVLAQTTGAPVVAISCAASRGWRLRSWDRLLVPRPFSRIVVAVGAARPVPRQLDADRLDLELRALEEELGRLGRVAAERLRTGDSV